MLNKSANVAKSAAVTKVAAKVAGAGGAGAAGNVAKTVGIAAVGKGGAAATGDAGAARLATKEKLIDAAIESIYQHGYSDTTVSKISDLADVSVGTVHHHFDSKEQLIEYAMRRLLTAMNRRVVEGCADAKASPRSRLWAVIQSVLGEEQSVDKVTDVWLQFWVQAEHDDKLRRLRDIYNRRLFSNVRCYLKQILREIGASNIDERTQSGAAMLIAMMHGVWVSYIMREDLSQGLANGRALVWETLEMFLSRAREPLAALARGDSSLHESSRIDAGLADASSAVSGSLVPATADILQGASVEILAKDVKNLREWRRYAPDGMAVYIPHFRVASMGDGQRARMAAAVIESGLTPVAHIAARNVKSADDLDKIVAGLSAVGARDVLLLGGGENPPVGQFDSALQMLETGVLQRYGIARVGFAGHPEEHPEQPREVMRQALLAKMALARAQNLECYVVTQFGFSTRPFIDFLDWLRSEGATAPVYLGVAGRVNAARLMKFGMMLGIGRSLGFLKKQFSKTMSLVNYSPEGLLAELTARISVRDYGFPVRVHFYPFGATAETLALIHDAGAAVGDFSTA